MRDAGPVGEEDDVAASGAPRSMGRVLIADDEETFLFATADLLRQEGYECDCASDAKSAASMLKERRYDILISDIKMPGNAKLEFIHEVPALAKGLPVILVTGYPTLDSAIQSIHLPVVAYLTKPIDIQDLVRHLRSSVHTYRVYSAVQRLHKRVESWSKDLSDLEALLAYPKGGAAEGEPAEADSRLSSVDLYLDLTFRNLLGSLRDVKHLTSSMAFGHSERDVCHLLNCPKLSEFSEAMRETIRVLEKTKGAFKSKSLGDLRRKLEGLVYDG